MMKEGGEEERKEGRGPKRKLRIGRRGRQKEMEGPRRNGERKGEREKEEKTKEK